MGKQPGEQLSLLDLLERPPIEALYSAEQIYDTTDFRLFSRLTEDHRFDRRSAKAQPKELAKMAEERKSQLDKFKEVARQLEADDDDERFEERLKQIVKQKPDERKDD